MSPRTPGSIVSGRATLVERAFELAGSGAYVSVTAVRHRLRAEGYADVDLQGPRLMRQLRDLCAATRNASAAG